MGCILRLWGVTNLYTPFISGWNNLSPPIYYTPFITGSVKYNPLIPITSPLIRSHFLRGPGHPGNEPLSSGLPTQFPSQLCQLLFPCLDDWAMDESLGGTSATKTKMARGQNQHFGVLLQSASLFRMSSFWMKKNVSFLGGLTHHTGINKYIHPGNLE